MTVKQGNRSRMRSNTRGQVELCKSNVIFDSFCALVSQFLVERKLQVLTNGLGFPFKNSATTLILGGQRLLQPQGHWRCPEDLRTEITLKSSQDTAHWCPGGKRVGGEGLGKAQQWRKDEN